MSAEELSGAHKAVAAAIQYGPDAADWLNALADSGRVLEVIEENGYVVMSRSLLDELERQAGR